MIELYPSPTFRAAHPSLFYHTDYGELIRVMNFYILLQSNSDSSPETILLAEAACVAISRTMQGRAWGEFPPKDWQN